MLKSSFDTASVIEPACLTQMYRVSPADYLSNKFWNLIFGSFNLIGMQIKKQTAFVFDTVVTSNSGNIHYHAYRFFFLH